MPRFLNAILAKDTTDCTGLNTGSLQSSGGLYVAKQSRLSGILNVLDSTASTTYTNGAIITPGGVGCGTLAVNAVPILPSQTAKMVFAAPNGSAGAPSFRALVPTDYPVFIGSGGTHAIGAVPDPGASAGTTKYLREDGSWQVPPDTNTGFANPMTLLGDLIVGGASGTPQRLAGNTLLTPQFLSSTGNGSNSAVPVWVDVTGTGKVVLDTNPTIGGNPTFSGRPTLSNNLALRGTTTAAAQVSLLVLTADANNITRFVSGVDAGGFQWTNQAQTVPWMYLSGALLNVSSPQVRVGTSIGATDPQSIVTVIGGSNADLGPVVEMLRTGSRYGSLSVQSNKLQFAVTGSALRTDAAWAAALGMDLDENGVLTVDGGYYLTGGAFAFDNAALGTAIRFGSGSTYDFTVQDRSSAYLMATPHGTKNLQLWGKLQTVAGTTAVPSINVPNGAAPTVPVLGDMWAVGGHIYYYDGSTAKDLTAGGGGLTNPMTTPGDMIVGGAAGAPARLAKSTDGLVLTMVSGTPAWATSPALGGGGSGATVVDFGSLPTGSDSCHVDITGQAAIVAGSSVDAWIVATASSNHTMAEHWEDPIRVVAGNIVPGVGFTIYAVTGDIRAYGQYNVQWAWK